ncbi:signal peptidase I [Cellulosimicrobium protaetiae]
MPVRRRAPATTPRRPGSAHVCRCCARSRSSWSAPQDTGEHLIKRVIGTPGDHVVCCDAEGRVSVNGVSIDETYIKPGSIPSRDPFDRTVPEDMLFVMGDNRQNSADSRYSTGKPGGGFVRMRNVVGTAFDKVWPPTRACCATPAVLTVLARRRRGDRGFW